MLKTIEMLLNGLNMYAGSLGSSADQISRTMPEVGSTLRIQASNMHHLVASARSTLDSELIEETLRMYNLPRRDDAGVLNLQAEWLKQVNRFRHNESATADFRYMGDAQSYNVFKSSYLCNLENDKPVQLPAVFTSQIPGYLDVTMRMLVGKGTTDIVFDCLNTQTGFKMKYAVSVNQSTGRVTDVLNHAVLDHPIHNIPIKVHSYADVNGAFPDWFFSILYSLFDVSRNTDVSAHMKKISALLEELYTEALSLPAYRLFTKGYSVQADRMASDVQSDDVDAFSMYVGVPRLEDRMVDKGVFKVNGLYGLQYLSETNTENPSDFILREDNKVIAFFETALTEQIYLKLICRGENSITFAFTREAEGYWTVNFKNRHNTEVQVPHLDYVYKLLISVISTRYLAVKEERDLTNEEWDKFTKYMQEDGLYEYSSVSTLIDFIRKRLRYGNDVCFMVKPEDTSCILPHLPLDVSTFKEPTVVWLHVNERTSEVQVRVGPQDKRITSYHKESRALWERIYAS
jgi:hypothetical protein